MSRRDPGGSAGVRVFFALWPDAATTDALARIARRAVPTAARRMRPETLHLTLAFVGDIDAARLPHLAAIGDDIVWPEPVFTFDHLGYWPHNHIVWAGSRQSPPVLADLAGRLSDALVAAGFSLPQRTFTPHVTLARKVVVQDWSAPRFEPIEWRITGARLVLSQRTAAGASYRTLAHWTDTV